jgi:hypothetical protein
MGEGEIVSIRPCGTSRVLLHAVKSYDMGPSRFTSHPRGRCAADFYRPEKSIALAGFGIRNLWVQWQSTVYRVQKYKKKYVSKF